MSGKNKRFALIMTKYVSSAASRLTAQGFGIALVGNVGDAQKPEFIESFKIYQDPRKEFWVAGVEGVRYGIEFIVPQTGRYKSLCTVDGRSITTGPTI